jgi:dTDP-4-amino-4,6-dideoxygalactose transaminase
MINVTKTYLPPLEEYVRYLEGIWERGWLTNHGVLTLELEQKLKEYLDVKHLYLVNNGTIALQIAIKALGLKDEIITTPFSYVATVSSIVWENCKPVFCDIIKDDFTIDVNKIEKLITRDTSAILATHVYGFPCNVEKINLIAQKHNLRVIYDAAHAFGVKYKSKSVLQYGDISTLSFHATKLFHTVEGGAVITNDDDIAHKISYMRNFGHNGPEAFFGLGINGKISEFHSAMGLCILPKIENFILIRKEIKELYDNLLKHTALVFPVITNDSNYNYSYYPVIFPSEEKLLKVRKVLNDNEVFPRRYFYPSLNSLNYVNKQDTLVSEDISKRVLCLPIYIELDEVSVNSICNIIIKNI